MEITYATNGIYKMKIKRSKYTVYKRFIDSESMVLVSKIELHFKGGVDLFFFEDEILAYNCISLYAPAYLQDIYIEAAQNKLTEAVFFKKIKEATLTKLGFDISE